MRYRVLGSLEVEADGGSVVLGGQKERLLLALLLTRPNQVVSVEALLRGLWGEQPPPTAAKTLQSHVMRLRRALEPGRVRGAAGEVLVTREPGYLLRVAPGGLDAARYEELAADGRRALADGSVELAGSLLREALGLWRGQAFEEFTGSDVVVAEAHRLAELRLVALEDRLEADLRLGRHRELVAELEGLVRDQPLRERLWAQLMLALYRSGRQADALAAYQRARKVLVEELGIDPGAELGRLHAAILAQDPGLDLRSDPSRVARRRLGWVGREEGAEVVSLFGSEQPSRAAAGALAKASGEVRRQAGVGAGAQPADQGEQVVSLADGGHTHLHGVQAQPADQVVEVRQAGGGRRVVPARLRRPGWRVAAAGLVVALLVSTALVAGRAADRGSDVATIASDPVPRPGNAGR
jgi:DNA-binding SARP family transcriptional activator